MSKTVSQVLVETLHQAGARRCYGIVGDTINHFTDAVRQSKLEWVHVRHEEVGALAAGGEAYMTGELAVCAGTTGPGSLHFVNGIAESHRNGAPVVLIASNVASQEAGLDFPQELDQKKIYEQMSVFCQTIAHPDQARRLCVQAAQAALALKGVAVLIVHGDMFERDVADTADWTVNRPSALVRPSETELAELAARINAAKAVTIYAGYGARNARREIVQLAERIKAPVAHTSRAKEFIEPDNPYNVGMTGILGNKAGMQAVSEADLTLALGADFAYTQFYPPKQRLIQIDRDATHLGRRAPVSLGLVGDIAPTLSALLPLVVPKGSEEHLNAARQQWQKDQKGYAEAAKEPDPTLIHPQFVAQTLDRLAGPDAIFTADGGSPMVWALRHLSANGSRRFLISLLHGTMANAYPQALGIAKAYPDRQVIALCGDGGLTMLLGDLLTLVQQDIPVKILVFNNGSLGFVEMEQRIEGLLDAYTELRNPNFAELASTCEMKGLRVEKSGDLEGAMKDWLRTEGPALLDVKVNRMELVMPPKIEVGQLASTAMFGVKAVLDGRAREVVSMVKNNFWR